MKALILSNALDTNGQNTRYVRAAEKHGTAESVLQVLAIGKYDPAGVVGRYVEAAERNPVAGLRIRSAQRDVYEIFDFPIDLRWGRGAGRNDNLEVRRLAEEADLIHLNNSDAALAHMGLRLSKKPMLIHYHGSLFRMNPGKWLALARSKGWVQAVSTIDLQQPAPERLPWLPTAYDVGALSEYAAANGREPDGRVRIVHCPTGNVRDDPKHTELFVAAVQSLIDDGLPIDLVVVRNVSQAEVIRQKAQADIVYDQLMYGYGCNSVEAWAMGKPVIAGADQWTLRRMKDLWGALPFVVAQSSSLKGIIRKMVQSEQMRQDAAATGHAHVLRFHDELPALTILAELYHDAIALRNKPRIEGKGVQFRSARKKVMTYAGQPVDFREGVATVTDVEVVEKLRDTVKRRPRFGIEEVA